MRVAAEKTRKIHQNPVFWGFKVIQVIDVDIPKKLIASACYGKQHVCACLQPILR